MTEETLFSEGGVTVTKTRIVIKGDTYALAQLTSCKVRSSDETDTKEIKKQNGLSVLAIIVAITMWILTKTFWVVMVVLLVWLIVISKIKTKYKMHHLLLGSASGEVEAIRNHDEDFIKGIRNAVTSAIIERG